MSYAFLFVLLSLYWQPQQPQDHLLDERTGWYNNLSSSNEAVDAWKVTAPWEYGYALSHHTYDLNPCDMWGTPECLAGPRCKCLRPGFEIPKGSLVFY